MFFLFDSNSKDGIGKMLATGIAVFLKFDLSQSLENYIKLLYCSITQWLSTSKYSFLKVKCTDNTKSTIKSALKSERKKKVSSLNKNQGTKNKMQRAKERYYRGP